MSLKCYGDSDGELIVGLLYPNIYCVLVHKKCRGRRQNVGKINTISAVKTRIHLNVLIKTGECFSDACLPAPTHSDEAAASHNHLLLNTTAAHRFSELLKVNLYLRRPKSNF